MKSLSNKLNEVLMEGLDSSNSKSIELRRQYNKNTLTHNGNNVREFFETHAIDISKTIEEKLGKTYRIVNRKYAALFYSQVTKQFAVVYESYRKGYYIAACMPMIHIYSPTLLSDTKFFKADSKKELVAAIQSISKSYTLIYSNL